MNDDLFEIGLTKRKATLGSEYVEASFDGADEFCFVDDESNNPAAEYDDAGHDEHAAVCAASNARCMRCG